MSDGENSKVLICVPNFASIDEIASAIVLARILKANDDTCDIYLGKRNFPLRLQKIFTPDGLKFYHPKTVPNQFRLSVKLPRGENVKSVRWEQDAEDLNIFVEAENSLGQDPEFSLEKTQSFSEVYLVGMFNLDQVENYDEFKQYTDISKANSYYFNNKMNPGIDISNYKGIIKPDYDSISEIVSLYAEQESIKLDPEEIKLLALGAYSSRQMNGREDRAVNKQLSSQITPDMIEDLERSLRLTHEDVESLNFFWSKKSANGPEGRDIEDMISLLMITPQQNPLIAGLFGHLPSKAEGKVFERFLKFDNQKLYISDDLKPLDSSSGGDFRRFSHFLIGIEDSSKSTLEQNQKPKQKKTEKPDFEKSFQKFFKEKNASETKSQITPSPQTAEALRREEVSVDTEKLPEEYIPLQPAK